MFTRIRLLLDSSLTAANAFDKAARLHGDSVLFATAEPLPYSLLNDTALTAPVLLSFVNRLGNLLLEQGLKRYDRVAIFKTNHFDYFLLAQAVIKAGGIAVPINAGMSSENLRHYLGYVKAKFLFTDEAAWRKTIAGSEPFSTVQKWFFPDLPVGFELDGVSLNQVLPSQTDRLEPARLHQDSVALIVHTSGTTGFPKGVMSTSGGMVSAIRGHYLSEPVSTRNTICVAGHYNHLVYYVGFYTSLLAGMKLDVLFPEREREVLEHLAQKRTDLFFAFPDVYLRMYARGLHNYDLSGVKIWISTADASHGVHLQAFSRAGAYLKFFGKKIMGAPFIDVIGSSEVGSGALRRIYLPFFPLSTKRCIGKRFWGGPRVKVADEAGKSLPPGVPGRLMVRGKMLFSGYWNAHETILDAVADHWWWTGDVVCRDRFNRYFHLDRFVDRVVSDQGVLHTLEAEEKLLTHPAVHEAVVIGLPGKEGGGQVPIAVVSAMPGVELNPATLLAWANERHFSAQPLAKVVVVEYADIPRGLTGKVLKRQLRARYLLE